jgi:predicted O-methyltransferase YrrM
MSFINPEIVEYIEKYSSDEPEILAELRRETWQKVVNPRMLSGGYQGRLLSMISKVIQPKNILEIGTFTGYSTLCLAEGLVKNGKIITIDKNEELIDIQSKYFKKSGFYDRITTINGDALTEISKINANFDLIFIDADKKNYLNYFEILKSRLNKYGILLIDNVLWNGKVVEETENNDIDTQVLKELNQRIKTDNQYEIIMLPVRDGLSIVRKIL